MTITSSGLGSKAIKTFDLLDKIVTVLGGTKLGFWPLLSSHGSTVHAYGSGQDAPEAAVYNETTLEAIQTDFAPSQHVGGVYSYYLDVTLTNNIQVVDNANLSHAGTAGMSLGAWVMMTEALGTKRTVISKYDATGAGEDREYTFDIDTSGNLVLELYDETNNASEIGTGSGDVLVPYQWQFIVATYDGTAATPDVHLYKNASDTLAAGTTTETGAFADMVAGGAALGIGAQVRAASTVQEFEGRVALPFTTGKELTAAEVTTLYGLGQTLLGI